MRAVAVEKFGAVPRLMDLSNPTPRAGEAVVRLTAAGMNPFDWKIADGTLKARPHVFPLVLGVDGAGTVETVGPGVDRFRAGDRIFGSFLHNPVGTGTYTEYAPVPEGNAVSRVPDSLTDREAAALPTAGITTIQALGQLEPGKGSTFLVVGASGGIGSLAVPLARGRGARVIAVARAGSAQRLQATGASEFVDLTLPDWHDRVRALVPGGVNAALDLMNSAAGFAQTATLVQAGGRIGSTIGAASGAAVPPGVRAININLEPSVALLDQLTKEIIDGGVKVPVERTIALEEAPGVLAEIRSGRAAGKTVILLSEG
ncbi:MAG: NADP-dependent oxidoreductase [Thermoplasmata archaeon]